MFPLWEDVVAPVIDAVGARRVVEIGALRGETTTRMLKRLGAECELHVIDPAPQFDPAEHERAFPGRYHFHLGTSLEVLPDLPPADVVLVDGDHNWYTVYHELQVLAETAERSGAPLPVLVLHDVTWPYGRRDLYYAPERIPAEFRHPYRRAGMRPGQSALVGNGGMNRDMANAEHEGGPRNGVMTAVDDFVGRHPEDIRVVVLPIFYGLAIVAETRTVDEHPELAALLDRFESPEGQRAVVDLVERIRVDEAIFGQAWIRMLEEQVQRGVDRYLELVKSVLLGEHSLDHELRLTYLLGLRGAAPDLAALRDPTRTMPVRRERLVRSRLGGQPIDDGLGNLAPTTMGRAQLDRLGAAAAGVLAAGVEGDFAEVGVGGGGGAILLRATLHAHEVADRRVWVADRFLATAPPGDADDSGGLPPAVRRWASDINQVRDGFAPVRVARRPGAVPAREPGRRPSRTHPIGPLAVLRLGEGLGADVATVLELAPRASVTGRRGDRFRHRRPRRSSRPSAAPGRGWGSPLPSSGSTGTRSPGGTKARTGSPPRPSFPRRVLRPPAGDAPRRRAATHPSRHQRPPRPWRCRWSWSSTTCAGRRSARCSRWPAPTSGAWRTSTTRCW